MENETLQAADVHSRSTLVLSVREAAGLARREQDGWFIANSGEKFIVGKLTTKGEWRVIAYPHQPIVFSSLELAQLYLHEMGIERPRRLMAR